MKTLHFKILVLLLATSSAATAQVRPQKLLSAKIDSVQNANKKKDSIKSEAIAQDKLNELAKLRRRFDNKSISENRYHRKVIRLLADSLSEETAGKDEKQTVVVKKYLNNKLIDSTSYDSADATAKKSLPFYFRLYTDAKGFQKDQPNSLLQTEFGFNWKLDLIQWSRGDYEFTFFKNMLLPCVALFQNKKDSSFRYADVHYNKSKPFTDTGFFKSQLNVHTLNLIRYAHHSVSGKLNVFAIACKKKGMKLFLDAYGTFYTSGVAYDSLTYKLLKVKKEDARFQVYSVGGGFNAKILIRPPKSYFSLEASYTHFSLLLLSNDIKQSYGKLYNPDYNSANYNAPMVRSYNSKSLSQVGLYNIEVRYSPTRNDKKNDNTGTFLRFNFYSNPFIGFDTKPNYGNNFIQIQLGISHTFEELLSFVGVEKPK